MCQAGQAACQFGQPAVGKQLMDGGGFSRHSPRGDHGHCPEQSTAAGTDSGQHLTRRLPTNGLRVAAGIYKGAAVKTIESTRRTVADIYSGNFDHYK